MVREVCARWSFLSSIRSLRNAGIMRRALYPGMWRMCTNEALTGAIP